MFVEKRINARDGQIDPQRINTIDLEVLFLNINTNAKGINTLMVFLTFGMFG